MLQHPIDLMNVLFDLVLIAIGFWLAWNAAATRLKGTLGSAMRLISFGALILGVAHLTETVMDQHFHVAVEMNELVHRVFILVGFLSIAIGVGRINAVIQRNLRHRTS